MTDKNIITISCFFVFSLIIIAGFVSGNTIKDCMEKGNSKDYCYIILKP